METWLSGRIVIPVVAPKSGNTGEFDIWLTGRQPFAFYVAAAATGDLSVSKSESATVTDTATLFTDMLYRSVADSATLTDAPSLSVISDEEPALGIRIGARGLVVEIV